MSLFLEDKREKVEEDHGRPIARIFGGRKDGDIMYVSDDRDAGSSKIRLDRGEHLRLEPTHDPKGRDVLYIAGRSGSGKSTIALHFAQRYHELWPKRPVVLISRLNEDATLDKAKFLKRIRVESLVSDPMDISELGDCLLIVDDVEGLKKAEADAVQNVADMVGNLGRHEQVTMLYLSHLSTNYKQTRNLLSESMLYVVFPSMASTKDLNNLLGSYAGFDKKQIESVKVIPSRWIAVRRFYPTVVMSDIGCYLLNNQRTRASDPFEEEVPKGRTAGHKAAPSRSRSHSRSRSPDRRAGEGGRAPVSGARRAVS